MNILVLPDVSRSSTNESVLIAQNIIDLLAVEGYEVATVVPEDYKISNAVIYDCTVPKRTYSLFKRNEKRTYTDFYYGEGLIRSSYLDEDYDHIKRAIESFGTDLVIEIGRPAGMAAARNSHLPCWSVLHTLIFKEHSFNQKYLAELNQFLSNHQLEQILKLSDLYQYVDRRVAFGLPPFQSIKPDFKTSIYGLYSIPKQILAPQSHVTVTFTDTNIPATKLKKIVLDAFHGAPYHVKCYIEGIKKSDDKYGNVQFCADLKSVDIPGSTVCIHDCNDFVMNECIGYAIPQVAVYDNTYLRKWNSTILKRLSLGITIFEDDFSMESLYESYRTIVSNDFYHENTRQYAIELRKRGDLYTLFEDI